MSKSRTVLDNVADTTTVTGVIVIGNKFAVWATGGSFDVEHDGDVIYSCAAGDARQYIDGLDEELVDFVATSAATTAKFKPN